MVMTRRAPRRSAPSFLAAVLVGVAVAAPAQAADWGGVAVDSAGTAHFSWSRYDGAWQLGMGRSRAVDGTLTRPQYVSSPDIDVPFPRILAGPAGSALHYWKTFHADENHPTDQIVRARRRSVDGSVGAEQSISPGNVDHFAAAMDPKGNAVFVWSRPVGGKMVVETRRRSVSGALSAIQRLSSASPAYGAERPRVGVDAAGNAVAAWVLLSPTSVVQVRRRAVDGTLGPIQNLTTTTASAVDPQIGVDAAGNAVVAFRRLQTEGYVVQARRRSAAGGLSEIQTFSSPGATQPQVAVSPDAGAVVAWLQTHGAYARLYASRRPPGGSWTSGQNIAGDDAIVDDYRVGLDADGDAVLAWAHGRDDAQVIDIRRRSAAGVLSSIETLTPPGHVAEAGYFELDLAVEPGGGAVANWTAPVAGANQVHARRRAPTGELSPVQQISY